MISSKKEYNFILNHSYLLTSYDQDMVPDYENKAILSLLSDNNNFK